MRSLAIEVGGLISPSPGGGLAEALTHQFVDFGLCCVHERISDSSERPDRPLTAGAVQDVFVIERFVLINGNSCPASGASEREPIRGFV